MRGLAMFRKHGRTVINCPMLLKHRTVGVFEAITRDISASGVFIAGTPSLDERVLSEVNLGDELIARLENVESGSERLRLKVARLAQDGIALTFI